MPVKLGNGIPVVDPMVDVVPDIAPGSVISLAVTNAMQAPEGVPPNFNELSDEEKARILAVQRFQGMRLRHDIKDQTIPLTRKTVDVP